MVEKHFLTAAEVAEYMDMSVSSAYKLIHRLNMELKEKGYIVTPGRISKEYFESKIFISGGKKGKQ